MKPLILVKEHSMAPISLSTVRRNWGKSISKEPFGAPIKECQMKGIFFIMHSIRPIQTLTKKPKALTIVIKSILIYLLDINAIIKLRLLSPLSVLIGYLTLKKGILKVAL